MTRPTGETPVVCTLDSADLAAQAERWKGLYARAGLERTETDDGLRIRFRFDEPAERELRELVAVEVQCCRWADWTIASDRRVLTLEIRSTGNGIAVIHGWFLAR